MCVFKNDDQKSIVTITAGYIARWCQTRWWTCNASDISYTWM